MNEKKRQQIVKLLAKAYNMELETVINYLANSQWLDGIRAKHIKDGLAADVTEELAHATQIAGRIKVLEGRIPGSIELKMEQKSLQPPKSTVDVKAVIKGVIEAEESAIAHYQHIIDACDGVDPVTQDMCVTIKGDEENHRREFRGFLLEAEQMRM